MRREETRTTTSGDGKVVVLTAIAAEYNAVKTRLSRSRSVRHPAGTIYRVGLFPGRRVRWEVILARVGAGNVLAAIQTLRAIEHFAPDLIIFLGVAGSLKDDVELGDVVFADRVYGYEFGRADDRFRPRPHGFVPTHRFVELALYHSTSGLWRRRLGRTVLKRPVEVHIGALASGDKVLGSNRAALASFLKTSYSDALAVEMEGYGFLEAAHLLGDWPAFVVRGVSDRLTGKDSTHDAAWQPLAARSAAAFAFEVLADADPADFGGRRSESAGTRIDTDVGETPPLPSYAGSPGEVSITFEGSSLSPVSRVWAEAASWASIDADRHLVGQTLQHRYHIDAILGEGAVAVVVRARDGNLGDLSGPVAIKIFPRAIEPARRIAISEVTMSRRLRHPNIIGCFETGRITEGAYAEAYYVVIELACQSLASLIRDRPLTHSEVKTIARDIASALAFLHDQEVAHLDVKPQNILRVDHIWKLADFGFAVALELGDDRGGTPIFMAPERYRKIVTAASDIYSLGVTLLACLTGGVPPSPHRREESTVGGLARTVEEDRPFIPPDVPDPWYQIIDACLADDPASRPTAKALVETISRLPA